MTAVDYRSPSFCMGIRDYRDLNAWQEAMELDVVCYRLSIKLPASERFELARQIRGAASSIPANIAEGNSRSHLAEYVQFVSIARPSAAELRTHLEVCHRRGLLSEADCSHALRMANNVLQLVTGLQKSLRRKLDA